MTGQTRLRGTMFEDVGEFHAKFDLPRAGGAEPPRLMDDPTLAFRIGFMQEELNEFILAHHDGDLERCADALCDLVYVALGTGHVMGLPLDACWGEVQRANMAKERATGADDPRSVRKSALDVVKPDGWRPPDHRRSLENARDEARAAAAGRLGGASL